MGGGGAGILHATNQKKLPLKNIFQKSKFGENEIYFMQYSLLECTVFSLQKKCEY